MKNYFKAYLILLITLLSFTLLMSLILTISEQNNLISSNISLIVSTCLSYVLIALLGYILGIKVRRKGLIHASILSLLIIILNIVVGNKLNDIITIIKIISKMIIIFFFTILGVNKKNSN